MQFTRDEYKRYVVKEPPGAGFSVTRMRGVKTGGGKVKDVSR